MNNSAKIPKDAQIHGDAGILVKRRRMTSALWSCELHKELCFTAARIDVEMPLSPQVLAAPAGSACVA
jgi:hypothetical protein